MDDVTEIPHEQAQSLVSKAWDTELTEDEAEQLVAHFAACTACREAAEGMAAFLLRLKRALGTDADPEGDD